MFDDAYLINSLLCCKAGLVGLVVLRDVALVSGAVYQRASSLGWQVRLLYSNFVGTLFFFLYQLLYGLANFGNNLFKSCAGFIQWKSWLDFFNLDGTSPQKVEPLFISKVSITLCFSDWVE